MLTNGLSGTTATPAYFRCRSLFLVWCAAPSGPGGSFVTAATGFRWSAGFTYPSPDNRGKPGPWASLVIHDIVVNDMLYTAFS